MCVYLSVRQFVFMFPDSSETTEPINLTFPGKILITVHMVLGQKTMYIPTAQLKTFLTILRHQEPGTSIFSELLLNQKRGSVVQRYSLQLLREMQLARVLLGEAIRCYYIFLCSGKATSNLKNYDLLRLFYQQQTFNPPWP